MRRKTTGPTHSWGIHLDIAPNPLIRRSDRIQSQLKRCVTVALILMLPVAVWIGIGTMSSQQDRILEQQTSLHQTTATTTVAADDTPPMQSEFTTTSIVSTDATWTYRGVAHQGQITVSNGSPEGTTATIWVDDTGARTGPPTTHADAVAASLFAGIGIFFVATLLLVGGYMMVRFRLDAHRYATWDRELHALTS